MTSQELACAEAISRVRTESRVWMFRKVDSIRLGEEHRSRRRVSIDAVLPPLPGLAYAAGERLSKDIIQVASPLMLPIALIKKGALRDLDVEIDGKRTSVLTTQENSRIAELVVLREIHPDVDVDDFNSIRREVREIVQAPAGQAREAFSKFVNLRIEDASSVPALSTSGVEILETLSNDFLFLVLVPADKAGQRVLIKYSYHWDRLMPNGGSNIAPVRLMADLSRCSLPSLGIGPLKLEVGIPAASDAESYHLEVHAPSSLRFKGLSMPPPGREDAPQPMQDSQVGQVAHGVGRYEIPPEMPAVLSVEGVNTGLRSAAWVVSAYTWIVFSLSLWLPGAFQAWQNQGAKATPLLLAVPAAAISVMARQQENTLTAYVWRPLRVIVVACAGLLMSGAAAVAVGLNEGWMHALWLVSILFSLVAWLALTGGICATMTAHRTKEASDDG